MLYRSINWDPLESIPRLNPGSETYIHHLYGVRKRRGPADPPDLDDAFEPSWRYYERNKDAMFGAGITTRSKDATFGAFFLNFRLSWSHLPGPPYAYVTWKPTWSRHQRLRPPGPVQVRTGGSDRPGVRDPGRRAPLGFLRH